MKKLVLGLIGSIGSGKSRVADLLARRGARVVSGDEAGHEALEQPEIRSRITERFGTGVLDAKGAIERRKLGTIVFADPNKRNVLESIVFLWIRRRLTEKIEQAQMDPAVPWIVLDAAVLMEAGWDDRCEALVFVDAPRAQRVERVARQRGWTETELAARERAQLPLDVKAARADFVLVNSGGEDQLEENVDRMLERIRTRYHCNIS
jgi:dephospho-CoA kinase